MAAILFHIFLAVFWVHFAQASLLSPKGVNYEGMTFKLYIQNDLALHYHVICYCWFEFRFFLFAYLVGLWIQWPH
jgi:hypothetical protein